MPEYTGFRTQLARLAPEVDEAAARELFERRRRRQPVPRWLMPAAAAVLIVAGVLGLAVVTADDAEAPAAPVDTTPPGEPVEELDPAPGETLIAGEDYFDVLHVAETDADFGQAWLATDRATYHAIMNPAPSVAPVDFGSDVALVMTRPDNACTDVVTRFEVTNQDDTAVWTPVFESVVDVCKDPLLSWLYVVTIDRAALGNEALIRVPGAPSYDVPEQIIEYTTTPTADSVAVGLWDCCTNR